MRESRRPAVSLWSVSPPCFVSVRYVLYPVRIWLCSLYAMYPLLERKSSLLHSRFPLCAHYPRYLPPACSRGIAAPLPLRPRTMPGKKRVRSAAGYDNQHRRSHARAVARLDRQLAPAQPTYEYHTQGPTHLELRLQPLVERRHAEAAFERFRGLALCALWRLYPGASFRPHTQDPGGQHLHPRWWRLYMNHSEHGYAVVEFA